MGRNRADRSSRFVKDNQITVLYTTITLVFDRENNHDDNTYAERFFHGKGFVLLFSYSFLLLAFLSFGFGLCLEATFLHGFDPCVLGIVGKASLAAVKGVGVPSKR